jgi:hypothetical protein
LKFCLHLHGVLLEVLLAFCMVNCLEFWLHLHGGLVGVWLRLVGLLIVGFLGGCFVAIFEVIFTTHLLESCGFGVFVEV